MKLKNYIVENYLLYFLFVQDVYRMLALRYTTEQKSCVGNVLHIHTVIT
jgi:hypothetical protein